MTSRRGSAPDARFHIPSLDGLRTVSFAIVFIGHAGLPQLLRDQTGVTVFFFLSGYLITTLLMREQDMAGRLHLSAFYIRRVFRILPAMYAVLVAAIMISVFQILPSTMTVGGAAASSLQVTNYWIVLFGRDALPVGMNALWSLSVEEHYYLAFPIVLITLTKFARSRQQIAIALAVVCVAILAWRIILYVGIDASLDRLYLSTDTRADSILWGSVFALAWNPVSGQSIASCRRPWLTLGFGLSLLAAVRIMPIDAVVTFGFTIEAIGLMFVFRSLICAPGTLVGRFLNWRPIAFLGVLSYSMYLSHRLILMLVAEHAASNVWIAAGIALPMTVVVSFAVYRLVELPMIRLGQRIRSRRKKVADAAPSGAHGA